MKTSDCEIMRALINQVQKAANGACEQEVTTFITKPMWRAFLRATGTPINAKPTQWIGNKTVRVFGSHTIVIPGNRMASVSLKVETGESPVSTFKGKRLKP